MNNLWREDEIRSALRRKNVKQTTRRGALCNNNNNSSISRRRIITARRRFNPIWGAFSSIFNGPIYAAFNGPDTIKRDRLHRPYTALVSTVDWRNVSRLLSEYFRFRQHEYRSRVFNNDTNNIRDTTNAGRFDTVRRPLGEFVHKFRTLSDNYATFVKSITVHMNVVKIVDCLDRRKNTIGAYRIIRLLSFRYSTAGIIVVRNNDRWQSFLLHIS